MYAFDIVKCRKWNHFKIMSQFQVSGIILEMWALNQVFFEIWIAHNMHDDQFHFLLASTNSRFHTTWQN